MSRKIHKSLRHDTLIQTSKAIVHIHYSKERNKPYLLLIHGMGIDAKTNWYKQVGYLSKHYNLIMPDLIFFGGSTTTEKDYSPEFQVQQIHEALALISIPSKINVMGFSYGGLVAAVYNELYPEQINKLIIIDGPVKFFSTQMADSLALSAGVPSMTNILIPHNLSDFKAMQKAVMSKKLPITARLKTKMIAHYFTPTLKFRQAQLNYLTEKQSRYRSLNYNLDKTPTLLMWGAKDGVVPLSVGENLHKHFPSTTKLIVFKKAKHDTHFRYAKKLNRAVVKFLGN